MYRLFPCIPFFRGGRVLIKKCKKNVFDKFKKLLINLKNAMLPMRCVFINVKKGISELGCWLTAEHNTIK